MMKKWLIALGMIFFVGVLVYGDGMLPLITGTALSLFGTTQDRTVTGTDVDHNGIRDDVDALIGREYQASRTQSTYAQMLAKTIQFKVTSDITRENALISEKNLALSIVCLKANTPDEQRHLAVRRLSDFTLNTLERRRVANRMDSFLGVRAIELPEESECKL